MYIPNLFRNVVPMTLSNKYWYEFQDASDDWIWKRCYGLDAWTFAPDGRIYKRQTSGNDKVITDDGK